MEKKIRICDLCGQVIEKDFYKLTEWKEDDFKSEILINIDICKDCSSAVLEFLQEKKK